ncbi:MAG TPA: hypothetical protein VII41_16060 [Steroidobacteraceae bacterium]
MKINRRMKLLCATVLAVGGYIVLFPAEQNTVQPVKSVASAPTAHHTALAAESHRAFFQFTDRVTDAPAVQALFASHSWYVAPPPPPPPPPPAAAAPVIPTAPPLPFSYMGSYRPDGAQTVFFLTQNDRVYEARIGDVLDGTYSVDALTGGQLVFTYKPLNVQQGLAVEVSK